MGKKKEGKWKVNGNFSPTWFQSQFGLAFQIPIRVMENRGKIARNFGGLALNHLSPEVSPGADQKFTDPALFRAMLRCFSVVVCSLEQLAPPR